jgi:hypothetical protein
MVAAGTGSISPHKSATVGVPRTGQQGSPELSPALISYQEAFGKNDGKRKSPLGNYASIARLRRLILGCALAKSSRRSGIG